MSSASSIRSQASSFRTAHSGRYTGNNVSPGPHSPAATGTQDVTNMMSHLNINNHHHHHFNGAAPYFNESDGGVGLAEVLTERDTDPWGPESPLVDNTGPDVSPQTTATAVSNQQYQTMMESPHHHGYGYKQSSAQYMHTSNLTAGFTTPHAAAAAQTAYNGNGGHQVDGINYGGFVTGANFASSHGPRRQAPSSGSQPQLESFMESSYPQYPTSPPNGGHFSVPLYSSPTSPVISPDSYEKEFVSSDGAYVYSSSPHSVIYQQDQQSYGYSSSYPGPGPGPGPGHGHGGRGGSGSTHGSGVFVGPGATQSQNNIVSIGTSTNRIDTRTAVVVVPERHTGSFSSDSRSTGRDHVLPGEDVLFDG